MSLGSQKILSVGKLTSHRASIEFFHEYCVIKAPQSTSKILTIKCPQEGNLYPLGVTHTSIRALTTSIPTSNQTETLRWHYRLGHPGHHVLKKMQQFE